MKSVQDALYNWLTIKVVSEARPEDSAARETKELFEKILREDHGIYDLDISMDETMYQVAYTVNGESKTSRFPIELINVLLNQINEQPERYQNYSSEN